MNALVEALSHERVSLLYTYFGGHKLIYGEQAKSCMRTLLEDVLTDMR